MGVGQQAPVVLAAVLYGSLSFSMGFLNKAVLSQYGFNYPLFILSCQMVLTLMVLEAMQVLTKYDLPAVTAAAARSFALPSFCYAIHATLSLVALEGMNIPMYGALKRCTPLVNLILAVTYLKKPLPSTLTITAIAVITVGCLIAGASDPSFNGVAYSMGAVSVVLQGLYQTLVQECGDRKVSPLQALHLNSFLSVIPFLCLTYAKGDFTSVLGYEYIADRNFLLLFTVLVVFGLLLNFSLFLSLMYTSALTTSVVGVIKSVLVTLIGYFAFGKIVLEPVYIAGILLNTAGGIAYTWAKYQDRQQRHIDLGESGIQNTGWQLKNKLSQPPLC